MHNDKTKIGSIIRQARESKGMTQKKLGEEIGVTARTIADIERNKRSPKHELLVKIVHTLNVPPEQLFWNEQIAYSPNQQWLNRALQSCDDQARATFYRIARAFLDSTDSEIGASKKADD